MAKKFRKEIKIMVEWEEGCVNSVCRPGIYVDCPFETCLENDCSPDCWAEFMKDAEEVEKRSFQEENIMSY